MKEIILQKLRDIEEKENVKILYCAESGSRAWGFSSPDSDYDVRFIYVRKPQEYLRIDGVRDVIEWQLDETLDINGWDLKKALKLLHNSNPTLFEWSASPIVYKTTPEWDDIVCNLNDYFIQKSGVYHYLSTAKSNYREYLKGETVRLKKYFYVLRPILACKWILSEQTPPPMLFSELSEKYLDKELKPYVEELLKIKISAPEKKQGKRIDALNEYIEHNIQTLTESVSGLPEQEHKDFKKLNEIFLRVLSLNV